MKNVTVEVIRNLIEGNKNRKMVIKTLKDAKIKFKNTTDLHEYFNLEIPVSDGVIRVYEGRKREYHVVKMTPIKMAYSGIPVFFG